MPKRNTIDDVWKYVTTTGVDDCWEWGGARNRYGYGYIGISGETFIAHRVVYALTHPGEITFRAPDDRSLKEFVLHECDNRGCCNPKHLFLGNYNDNIQDMKSKGRARAPRGHLHKKASLTAEQAIACRAMLEKGFTRREVREAFSVSERIMDRLARGESYHA